MSTSRRLLVLALALACAPHRAVGQEPTRDEPSPVGAPATANEPPIFASRAEAITVDVVVLDRDGNPVRDLSAADFTVFEDGDPQAIVAFEARDLTPPTRVEEPPLPVPEPAGATNERAGSPRGRVLALLIDDLGLAATTAPALKAALVRWLRHDAHPFDDVTIMTTSGDLWWSDLVGRGRDALITTIESFSPKQLAEPVASGGMTPWEAYQIAYQQENLDFMVGAAASRPQDLYGVPEVGATGQLPTSETVAEGATVLDRVAQRWLHQDFCEGWLNDPYLRRCKSAIMMEARRTHEAWRVRAETVYGAVGRLSRSMAGIPGRKSILLISEQFLEDTTLTRPFRDAIDASQRANTAIYFLGALGVAGTSIYGAAADYTPRAQDVGSIGREEAYLATAGAETLAEATGGVLTRSNDLAEGLDRMATESSVYYLLGYQPEEAPDGRWHDLKVEVAREGVQVRARKSYLAARAQDLARAAARRHAREVQAAEKQAPTRPLAPDLLAGAERGKLPLRLSAYVDEPDTQGGATVKVVVEVDNTSVGIDRATTPWRARLDVTVMAAGVARAPLVPVDERMDLSLEPKDVGNGWWLVQRDARLLPGSWQIRVHVKDATSGASGLVTQRIEVPATDQPYISTPMLTDRALPAQPGLPPAIIPAAHRRFGGRGGAIVCQYEVFGYAGGKLPGIAQLVAGYTLHRAGAGTVRVAPATPIDTRGKRAVRRIMLPLRELSDGRYVLVITVQDKLAGRTLVARESFVVDRRSAGD